MFGLVSFFSIALWFFFVESYTLENSLNRGCVYSFWAFLYSACYNSYIIITSQLPRILALKKIKDKTIKWSFLDVKEFITVVAYILLYWIQVCLVILPILSENENATAVALSFILISLTIIQVQNYILINGIMNIVKKII